MTIWGKSPEAVWVKPRIMKTSLAGQFKFGHIKELVPQHQIFHSFQDCANELSDGDPLYFAIPDLHGRVDLFEKCVDMLQDIPGRVVFLGDYIDRLPSWSLVDQVIQLEALRPDYVFLPGNHEWMCLEWFIENELNIRSGLLKQLEVPEDTLMQEWKVRGEVPASHVQFFERILRKLYHLSAKGHLLFVHAGVERSLKLKALESMDPDHFLWARRMPADYVGPTLIHGHTFAGSEPVLKGREVNLETRCWLNASRPLTVGVFKDLSDSQQAFQGVVQISAPVKTSSTGS